MEHATFDKTNDSHENDPKHTAKTVLKRLCDKYSPKPLKEPAKDSKPIEILKIVVRQQTDNAMNAMT